MARKPFNASAEEHQTAAHRHPLLQHAIASLIKERHVIALQEVDLSMGPVFEPLFESQKYHVIKAHYSTMPGRDGFGNWLCIPLDVYEVVGVHIERIGEFIVIPADVSDSAPCERKVNHDVFTESELRDTTAIIAILRFGELECVVTAYHMPCAFWWLPVMMLHADTLLARIAHWSEGRPRVLLGDFNTTPQDKLYQFLTAGIIAPALLPSPRWVPQGVPTSSSVLLDAGQHAPAHITNWNGQFKERIDYVFHDQFFDVASYKSTALEQTAPYQAWGSDHAVVTVTLTPANCGFST